MRNPLPGVAAAIALTTAPLAVLAQPAPSAADDGPILQIDIPGEAQLRYSALTDLPLATTPGRPGRTPSLGQNLFFESWLRLRPRVVIGERMRVVFQADLARSVVPDESAVDVGLAREPRVDLLPYGALDMRQGYIEWLSPVGAFRVGQQGYAWGLGVVANDGDRAPTFGDYRHGDLVERVSFTGRPGGRDSDLAVLVAGDLVYRDASASLAAGDHAVQGVAAAYYEDHACRADCERRRVGALVSWRDAAYREGSWRRVFIGDLSARWEWPTPDHTGTVFAGAELAIVAGNTNASANPERVLQLGGAARVGIERPGRFRVTLEGGYASGDRDPDDATAQRMTLNPSHRVGMILFPELIAWETARSAVIASETTRPAGAAGRRLLPTDGGVSGAAYLYPTAVVNLGARLDLRLGAVLAVATSDQVDPTSLRLYGAPRNYRGGDPTKRDLGLELDLGVQGRFPLAGGVTLTGGVQGAVLFAGRAFDDAAGRGLGRLAMATARVGMEF
jgi:hypothetical protein